MTQAPNAARVRLGALVALTLGLAGCASGLHLYSAARDNQAQAAKTAWASVDLPSITQAEQRKLDKLLEAELKTQDQLALAIRDHELRAMVAGPSLQSSLLERLDHRLQALATSAEQVKAAQQKQQAIDAAKAQRQLITDSFALLQQRVPDCAEVFDATQPEGPPRKPLNTLAGDKPLLRAAYDEAVLRVWESCKAGQDVEALESGLYAPIGGEVTDAWNRFLAASRALAQLRTQAAGLVAGYQRSRQAYEEAAAGTQSDSALADQLKAALLKLENNPFAKRFLSQQRLSALDDFIEVVTRTPPGEPPPATATKPEVAAILVPRLLDDARHQLAQSRKPLLVPLLIRRQHDQLELEAAQRDIDSREADVRIAHDIVGVLWEQAQALKLAGDELAGTGAGKLGGSVVEAFQSRDPRVRLALYSASARYLDVIGRLDARRYKLETMRVAVAHQRALAYADSSVQQWQSLIGTSVGQLADYHGGGLKPDAVGTLLGTLGILSIGVGVNK